MTKDNKAKERKPTRRTQVKELPKKEKQLSNAEAKKIKGGFRVVEREQLD